MKLIIISALISVCAAGVLPQYFGGQRSAYYRDIRPRASLERNAAILRSNAEVNEQGYQYAYDTENGIHADGTGREADGIQAYGSYSYTGDDGQVYSVRYTADSNGFQAQGAHIPTPPPVPAEIARALEQNARDEAAGIFDDGSYRAGKYADIGSGVALARSQYQPARQFLAPQSRYRPGFNY